MYTAQNLIKASVHSPLLTECNPSIVLEPHGKDREILNRVSMQNIFAKVEQAKQEWEATLDVLPQLICLIDEDGKLLRANRTIER